MKKLRVALVYDRVNKFGGAERVLLALHELWPDAPLYTAVYDKHSASWADVFEVRPSFLQKIPFAKTHHELFAWATPIAFETFSFDQYDIVISITSAEAKNIITRPSTLHICYCLTPTRYLWSGVDTYISHTSIGVPGWLSTAIFKSFHKTLQYWDLNASRRPDAYIAISEHVSSRIKRYYHVDPQAIVYPPVQTEYFTPGTPKKSNAEYFLTVARLVGHKRVDITIDACTALGVPLVVVGDGVDMQKLKKRSGPLVKFVSVVSDEKLRELYRYCTAFVFSGDEDFGIAAAEAQSCGKPVIAYAQSGLSEIILPGKTGVLFSDQTVDCLKGALNSFHPEWYDSSLCRLNAQRFSTESFIRGMKQTVETVYNTSI